MSYLTYNPIGYWSVDTCLHRINNSDVVIAGDQIPLRQYVPEIESGGLSVIGPVREENQDSIRLSDHAHPVGPGLLFAIADGMGGYAHGGMASLLALESFSNTMASQNGGAIHKTMQRGVEAANLQVYKRAQQLDA